MSDTLEWLRRLYGRSPGYFAITPFKGGRPMKSTWLSTSDADLRKAAKAIEKAGETADVYVSAATHKEPQSTRGTRRSVLSIPGFWADLDIGSEGHKPASLPNPETEEQALEIIDGLPEPSAILHSGGGLQVWWFFEEPWIVEDHDLVETASEDWQRLLVTRAEQRGLHVDALGDLARILRAPGSQNHKAGKVRPVEIRSVGGPVHPLVQLSSLGIPTSSTVDERGDSGSADSFPLSWAEILEPHGYTKVGRFEDSEPGLWSRPGKSAKEGHSLTTNTYGVPVAVNFSASDPKLPSGPGQRLNKLRVYALLNFDGDMRKAKAALKKMFKNTPEELARIAERFAGTLIDWTSLWTDTPDEPQWIVEPLIEHGRQVAFYSDAKAGKSLLWLDVLVKASLGEPTLISQQEPKRVLYLDQENVRQDIRERLAKMGRESAKFDNLFYYSFPDLSYLDTEEGGRELYALAKYHAVDLVVIDTLSRVVEGLENDNDTYHSFYNHTGVRLKADGIALVRLDHSGKDVGKGMRGASSKTTDVDEVWSLEANGDILSLKRTHSRTHHGQGELVVLRQDEPALHHALATGPLDVPHKTTSDDVEVWLDLQGVSPKLGLMATWDEVKDEAKALGFSREQVREAQRKRRTQ